MAANREHQLRQAAIRWFVRLQTAAMDDPERSKFEQWLLASQAHQQAYEQVATLWERFDSAPALENLADAMEQQAYFKKPQRNGRIKKTVAGALSAAVLVFGLTHGYQEYERWQAAPVLQAVAQAGFGQISRQRLQDGSELTLNSGSDAEVTFYRDRREVHLKRGEAIFDVARDPDRPFIVLSGNARVTVYGTRFAVNRLQRLVRISVDHGLVKVEPQNTTASPLWLRKGEVAEVPNAAAPLRSSHQAADAFSFTQGMISFDHADLSEIVETLSRYRRPPLQLQAALQHSPAQVTAVIKTRNIEKFISQLPQLAPVTIDHRDDSAWVVPVTSRTKK